MQSNQSANILESDLESILRLNHSRCSIADSDVFGITNIKYNQFYKAHVDIISPSLGQFLGFSQPKLLTGLPGSRAVGFGLWSMDP